MAKGYGMSYEAIFAKSAPGPHIRVPVRRARYDFAIAYHRQESEGEGHQDEVVESLVPIYFGRTASFVLKTWEMANYEAEDLVQELARKFETLKPYLVKRWKFGKKKAGSSKR